MNTITEQILLEVLASTPPERSIKSPLYPLTTYQGDRHG